MAYIGGKSKGAEHILKILNDKKYDNMNYIEPFIGYGHILRRVQRKKTYIASDCNKLLIILLKGLQNNLKYPNITKKNYYTLKKMNKKDFITSIAAFCYSYNGKEWGGYTKSSKNGERTNYPAERKRYYDTLKKNDTFMNTKIYQRSYTKFKPKGSLIYCDPPYKDKTGYNCGKEFNHKEFWDIMRKWSKTNVVYISEYNAPSDFKCVIKRDKYNSLNGKGSQKIVTEKLYVWKGKRIPKN